MGEVFHEKKATERVIRPHQSAGIKVEGKKGEAFGCGSMDSGKGRMRKIKRKVCLGALGYIGHQGCCQRG